MTLDENGTIDESATIDENEDKLEIENMIGSQSENGTETGGEKDIGQNEYQSENDSDDEIDMETVETMQESEELIETDIDDGSTIVDPGPEEASGFQNGVIDDVDRLDEDDHTDDYDHTEVLNDVINDEFNDELISVDNPKQRGYWEVIETPMTSPTKESVDLKTAQTLDDIKSLLSSEMDGETQKVNVEKYVSGNGHVKGSHKEYGIDTTLETKSGSWTVVTPADMSANGFMSKDAVELIECKDTIEDNIKAIHMTPMSSACSGSVLSTVKEDAPPPTAAQLRYAHYLAMKDLDLCSVGRRVRVVAEGNKYR